MTTRSRAPTKKLKPGAEIKPKKKASATKAADKDDVKTKPTGANVAAFIDAVENDTRRRDAKTLLAMMKKVTGEKPTMWGPSIIGFGAYRYKYESGREGDMLAVGFSPRKANMALYVLGSLADDEPLLQQLGPYKRGKSCLYISDLSKVDLRVLQKIVAKSYKAIKSKWG